MKIHINETVHPSIQRQFSLNSIHIYQSGLSWCILLNYHFSVCLVVLIYLYRAFQLSYKVLKRNYKIFNFRWMVPK